MTTILAFAAAMKALVILLFWIACAVGLIALIMAWCRYLAGARAPKPTAATHVHVGGPLDPVRFRSELDRALGSHGGVRRKGPISYT